MLPQKERRARAPTGPLGARVGCAFGVPSIPVPLRLKSIPRIILGSLILTQAIFLNCGALASELRGRGVEGSRGLGLKGWSTGTVEKNDMLSMGRSQKTVRYVVISTDLNCVQRCSRSIGKVYRRYRRGE